MGFLSGSRGCGPIGLDLGAATIRLTQLRRDGDGWRVQAAAAAATPDGWSVDAQEQRALAAVIEPLLRSSAFRGRRVVSCLPAVGVQYKNLRLPKMPPAEMSNVVSWEAAERMQLNPEGTRFEFFNAGEVRQGDEARQELIVLAAAESLVDDHLALLTALGLDPVAIDVVPGALARFMAVHHVDEGDDPARVLLDVGHASAKILICTNGRVLFFKLTDVGGRRFDEAVGSALELPVAEASQLRCQARPDDEASGKPVSQALRSPIGDLVRELSLCLRYYSVTFGGKRPGAVVLSGGAAAQPELAELIVEQAGIEVEVAAASRVNDPEVLAAIDGPGAVWTVSLGLALSGAAGRTARGAA